MKLSAKVEWVMLNEHISAEELSIMVRQSAITTMRGFNRRYFHWLFNLHNDELLDMQHTQLVEVGRGEEMRYEEHKGCHGVGCKECGWAGQVVRWF